MEKGLSRLLPPLHEVSSGLVKLESLSYFTIVMLAATLNFGFVYGATGDPLLHHWWQLVAALVANGIAVAMKISGRRSTSPLQIAAGLVALLQLLIATSLLIGALAVDGAMPKGASTMVVSLAAAALLANVVSLTALVIEALNVGRIRR